MEGYRTIVPRFCSEFGQQAPADFDTIREFLAPEDLQLGSRGLEHRQRATGGSAAHIDTPMLAMWGRIAGLRSWMQGAQRLQAFSMRIAIEWLRFSRPRCMGALVWQFNDMWPGISWSLIDCQGRVKQGYLSVRNAYATRILTIQAIDGIPVLYAINDSGEEWRESVCVRRKDGRAKDVAKRATIPFTAPPMSIHAIAVLDSLVGRPSEPQFESALAMCGREVAYWPYGGWRNLRAK
jgi:beta-mannosidase